MYAIIEPGTNGLLLDKWIKELNQISTVSAQMDFGSIELQERFLKQR